MANWRTTIANAVNAIKTNSTEAFTLIGTKLNSLYTKIESIINDSGPVSTASTWSSSKISNELDNKVTKVTGKGLSANDYSDSEKNKLSGIEAGAEKNVKADLSETNTNSDSFVKGKGNYYTKSDVNSKLNGKVDKAAGKVLSDNNYTDAEKTKLAGLESSKWLGSYNSLAALQSAHPTGTPGNYADVDTGAGNDVIRYIWDENDNKWVAGGSGKPLTAAQIKQMYESNPDTNAFTDAKDSKLSGIENGAEKNIQADLGVSDVNSDAYVKGKSAYAKKTYVNTKTAAVQSNLDSYKNTQLAAIAVPDWKADMQQQLNF